MEGLQVDNNVITKKLDLALPYYPTHLMHQKAGVVGTSIEYHLQEGMTPDKILEEDNKAKSEVIRMWIDLIKTAEANPFIYDRIRIKFEKNEIVTADDINKAVEEERKQQAAAQGQGAPGRSPVEATTTTSQPGGPSEATKTQGNDEPPRQYPGPDYMFMFEEKAENGMYIEVCGRCVEAGQKDHKLRDLKKNDINFCRNNNVPMAMCHQHRMAWFATKENPDARATMRKELNALYEEYKDDDRFQIKEGIKPNQQRF